MDFDERAWKQAVYDGTAPKFQFDGIPGLHYSFGDALSHYEPYLDYRVRETIAQILADFGPFEKAWRNYVRERAASIAAGRAEAGITAEDEFYLFREFEQQLLNDPDRRAEWVRRVVTDRLDHLREEIKREAETPGTQADGHRVNFPAVGIYSRGRNCVMPFVVTAGFCPKCHEPLCFDPQFCDVFEYDDNTQGMICPACRIEGRVADLERTFGHRFHLIPFMGIPLAECVKKLTSRTQPAVA